MLKLMHVSILYQTGVYYSYRIIRIVYKSMWRKGQWW